METRAPYVLVGVFVLVMLAGIVVAALWFAQVEFAEQESYFDIYFAGSVTGLSEGSAVRYNGISVGRVTDIKLDPQDPTRVRVTVEIQSGSVVKSDSTASLEIQGLTGGDFINIAGGSREAPPLVRQGGQRYPVIASTPSGLQRVVTSAPEALSRLIALADQLSEVFSEPNRKAIGETLDNMRQLTATAASHSGDIDSALADGAAALHDLRATLDSANAILTSLNQVVAPNGDFVAAIKSVDQTSRQIAEVATRLDALLADNGPQLHDFTRRGFEQLDRLIAQTQVLVAQLTRIADTVERDPTRMIYGDRRPGYQPK